MTTQTLTAQACELADWVAALWSLKEGGGAHPPLVTAFQKALADHEGAPALRLFANLSQGLSRDQLIKGVVTATSGVSGAPVWAGPLQRTLAELAEQLAPAVAAPLVAYRQQAQELVRPLFAQLDPVREMAELIDERLPLTFEPYPSGLLPPPQAGRHGVLVPQANGQFVTFLFFGLPLDEPPAQYGITPAWFRRGSWHYMIKYYLTRLGAAPYAPLPEGEVKRFRHHLAMTLRYGLWRLAGGPVAPFLRLAEGQGFRLLSWFAPLMDRHLTERNQPLAEAIVGWAQRYAQALDELTRLAAAPPPPVPQAIACALMPLWGRGAQVVVPDHWLRDLAVKQRLEQAWRPFGVELCPQAERKVGGRAVVYRHEPADARGGEQLRITLDPEATAWQLTIASADEAALLRFAPVRLLQFGGTQATLRGSQLIEESGGDPLFAEILAEFR